MAVQIQKDCFEGLTGALDEVKSRELWPTTYATDHATAADPHWHSEDVHGWVVSGNFHLHDAEGQRLDLVPGDKFTIPAGTLHAEGEISEPVTLIIGLSEPLPGDRFLLPRDPSTLKQ